MDTATVFGILGVISNTVWPTIKRRKYLLMGQIVACVFMCTHFVLLGAYTGAAVMLVAGCQASLAIPLESHRRFKAIYMVSFLLTPLVCWYTWHGYPSVFSSLALVFFCVGNLQINVLLLRVFLLFCIFCWIGHNLLIGSYPALISNALALTTSIYGLAREFAPRNEVHA